MLIKLKNKSGFVTWLGMGECKKKCRRGDFSAGDSFTEAQIR